MVELAELLHILPHALVAGVEDMGTVPVYVDVVHAAGVAVAADVVAFLDHQAAFALLGGLMGEDAAIQPRAYNDIIVLFHSAELFLFDCIKGNISDVFLNTIRQHGVPNSMYVRMIRKK